jgi:Xaa-Pro aminopeptidase
LLREKGFAKAKVGLVDSGRGFPLPQLEEMKSALPEVQWTASHGIFLPMRLRKSARELSALRAAGRVLAEISDGAAAFIQKGRKEYQIVADIDRLARDNGVEDIRIMAGDDQLRPPNSKNFARVGNHWTVYLAIQHERYWVEAGQTYMLAADFKLLGAYKEAQQVIARMAAQLKPGNAVAAIQESASGQLGEFYASGLLYGLGNGIGLNQWEAPFLSEEEAREAAAMAPDASPLEENMTMALRAAFESEGRLVLYGDSFEVTASGAVSLTGR